VPAVEQKQASVVGVQADPGRHFPGGPDDPEIIFVRITVDRIELCVRGVTPDPFGSRHSVVERGAEGRWRLVSD